MKQYKHKQTGDIANIDEKDVYARISDGDTVLIYKENI